MSEKMVFEASDRGSFAGEQKVSIPLECAEDDKGGRRFEMLCVKYNEPAPWGWGDGTAEFAPGAFDSSLANIATGTQSAYIFAGEHSWEPKDIIAASTGKEGVCKVSFDSRNEGLYAVLDVLDSAEGDTAYKLVSGGALNTCSVGTIVESYRAETTASGEGERKVIDSAMLREVSLTIRPRYETTNVKTAADSEDKPEQFLAVNAELHDKLGALEAKVDILIAAQSGEEEVVEAAEVESDAEKLKIPAQLLKRTKSEHEEKKNHG